MRTGQLNNSLPSLRRTHGQLELLVVVRDKKDTIRQQLKRRWKPYLLDEGWYDASIEIRETVWSLVARHDPRRLHAKPPRR